MKVGRGTRLASEPHCLNCNVVVDGARCVDGDGSPSPGDVTMCIYCGHVMAFSEGLGMRELTDAEMQEIAGDPRLVAVGKAVGLLKRRTKP
jgi:hypothetical protein